VKKKIIKATVKIKKPMKTKKSKINGLGLYLLAMMYDIEPVLHGPFDSTEAVDKRSATIRLSSTEHGVYPVVVDWKSKKLSVHAYSLGEMDELTKEYNEK
jgi:hypothetical protein